MTQLRIAGELTNDGILFALAGSLAFLTAVIVIDPRLRKSAVGKSLIMLDSGLAALYIPSVLHRFFGLQISQVGFAWYYLGTVLTVGCATWWRTGLMVAAQVRAQRKRARASRVQEVPAPGGDAMIPPELQAEG
jgi:hypothetical protein